MRMCGSVSVFRCDSHLFLVRLKLSSLHLYLLITLFSITSVFILSYELELSSFCLFKKKNYNAIATIESQNGGDKRGSETKRLLLFEFIQIES
jgi:hypothetical protein